MRGVTEQGMEGLPCCGGDRAGYGRSTLVRRVTEQGMEGLPCYGGD